MLERLLLWTPDALLPLALVVIGLALMLGLLKRGRAFALIRALLLGVVLAPFVPALVSALPFPFDILVVLLLLGMMVHDLATLVFGKMVVDEVKKRLGVWLLALPFRGLWVFLRGGARLTARALRAIFLESRPAPPAPDQPRGGAQ